MNTFRTILNVGCVAVVFAAGSVQAVLRNEVLVPLATVTGFALAVKGSIEVAPDATLAGMNTLGYYVAKRSYTHMPSTKDAESELKMTYSRPGKEEVIFGATNYALRKGAHFVDGKYDVEKTISNWFDGSWTPERVKGFTHGYAKPFLAFMIKEVSYDLASAIVADKAGAMIGSGVKP